MLVIILQFSVKLEFFIYIPEVFFFFLVASVCAGVFLSLASIYIGSDTNAVFVAFYFEKSEKDVLAHGQHYSATFKHLHFYQHQYFYNNDNNESLIWGIHNL